MKTFLASGLAVLALLATALFAHGQLAPPIQTPPGGPSYAAGEVLVQFKPDVTDAQITTAFQQAGLGLIRHIHTPAMQERGQVGLTRARLQSCQPPTLHQQFPLSL